MNCTLVKIIPAGINYDYKYNCNWNQRSDYACSVINKLWSRLRSLQLIIHYRVCHPHLLSPPVPVVVNDFSPHWLLCQAFYLFPLLCQHSFFFFFIILSSSLFCHHLLFSLTFSLSLMTSPLLFYPHSSPKLAAHHQSSPGRWISLASSKAIEFPSATEILRREMRRWR